MTQFSSGKHEKLTADEYPFVRTYNGIDPKRIPASVAAKKPRRYENGFGEIVVTRLDGLPEFDRPLTNPANPVLVHHRARADRWPLDGYIRSLSPELVWQWDEIATPDQIDHARAVLTRLAALA